MGWLGKAIGGSLGLFLGGPVGAILGAVIGHQFDRTGEMGEFGQPGQTFTATERSQAVFFVATFSMLAKMARADGKVTHQEIDVIDHFIKHQLHFDKDAREMAIKIFNVAKESGESFEGFAQQYFSLFRTDRQMLVQMLDLLVRIAMADGVLHPNEEQMVHRAAIIFNISTSEYERIKTVYVQNNDKYYAVLGVNKSDSDSEVKKKYRQLVKEYHPDVVTSKGLPDEFAKYAADKFREIQEAYDEIMKERRAA